MDCVHAFWYSWRFQIPALAAGYRVVAPDMRGYNLSEKPLGIAAYHIDNLVADAAAMLQTFGGDAGGFLVGHDWGGLVAWHTAARHPELVKKLVVLNAPHPARYLEVLRQSPLQRLRSVYVAFFQLPWLPERLLTRGRGRYTVQTLRRSLHTPENFTFDDVQRYREAITRPGAATAALNYYRSMAWRTLLAGMREEPRPIRMPTLLLWGADDPALDIRNTEREPLLRWAPDLRIVLLEAGHFVHIDRPDDVNEKIIDFLGNK